MKNGDIELAALIAAVDGDERLELELGDALGRFRARRKLEIRDMQAAELLPLGITVVMERQHCSRATAYRRISKFKKSRDSSAA